MSRTSTDVYPNHLEEVHNRGGTSPLKYVLWAGGLGIVGYVGYRFIWPLLKGLGGALDAAGDVIDTATDIGKGHIKLILGMPENLWKVFAGGKSSWKPNPAYTPDFVASMKYEWWNKHNTSFTAAMIISTWAEAMVGSLQMKDPSQADTDKYMADLGAATAVPALKQLLTQANSNVLVPKSDASQRLYYVCFDSCIMVGPESYRKGSVNTGVQHIIDWLWPRAFGFPAYWTWKKPY